MVKRNALVLVFAFNFEGLALALADTICDVIDGRLLYTLTDLASLWKDGSVLLADCVH